MPLSGKRHATIVSVYAPTMTNPGKAKERFYDDLDSVISASPRIDKLIFLGDFNARVGTDHQTWEGVIGTEGIGKCNKHGLLLLKKVCRAWTANHCFPSANSQQDVMDASPLQTLASHWLCHSTKKWQSDKNYVWCRLLDRSQACSGMVYFCYSSSLFVCVVYIFFIRIANRPPCWKATVRLAFR